MEFLFGERGVNDGCVIACYSINQSNEKSAVMLLYCGTSEIYLIL